MFSTILICPGECRRLLQSTGVEMPAEIALGLGAADFIRTDRIPADPFAVRGFGALRDEERQQRFPLVETLSRYQYDVSLSAGIVLDDESDVVAGLVQIDRIEVG